MIRVILIAVFLFLYLLLGIPILGVLHLYGKANKEQADYKSLRLVQWAFRVILKISGVTLTVIGEDRIPDEAVLFIGNHRSYFDIVITYARCKRLTGYVAKKEMLQYPCLRDWMKQLYCLFLDRENTREGLKTILTAIDYIKSGVSICIFPEGTRNDGEELSLLPFHPGSFKIAEKSGCAIVPICLNNTASIFESHLPFVRRAHVALEYAEPIYPRELDKETRKHLAEYCQNIIKQTIEKNQEMV